MNESVEENGVFDVNTIKQATTAIIVDVDYAEVCRLCMSTIRTGLKDTSAAATMFTIYDDSIQFGHIAMALANVKVSSNRSHITYAVCNDFPFSYSS